jgi:hypothetical protein
MKKPHKNKPIHNQIVTNYQTKQRKMTTIITTTTTTTTMMMTMTTGMTMKRVPVTYLITPSLEVTSGELWS